MCNPRRVQVTVARQVREAWEREVARVVEFTSTVTGEARIEQPLDASLGGPALMALRMALENDFPGWREEGEHFRHDVEGGYVEFNPDRQTLTIVAVLSEELTVQGEARDRLQGELDRTVELVGEGHYYDDGYGGLTKDRAESETRRVLEGQLGEVTRREAQQQAEAAERERDASLRAEAQQTAQQRWQGESLKRQQILRQRATRALEQVGVRARMAFNQLLAHAYREAFAMLARQRGVDPRDIVRQDNSEYLEIRLTLPN